MIYKWCWHLFLFLDSVRHVFIFGQKYSDYFLFLIFFLLDSARHVFIFEQKYADFFPPPPDWD